MECGCSEDYGPCETHMEAIFHVDDRRPAECYAVDVATEMIAYATGGTSHIPAEARKVFELQQEAEVTLDALRWVESQGDTERTGDYSQRLSEICDDLEGELGAIGLSGGFDGEMGGFFAYRVTGGPLR